MNKKVFLLGFLIIFLLLQDIGECRDSDYRGKKILFINSYHQGYLWSDNELSGARSVLANTGVEFEVIYMDTKNNPGENFKKQAGVKVKKYIEKFKPDVVIAADDNAFKYVIKPYYRDAELPVVFCGINWDISVYDGPYSNTTGMIEVNLAEGIFKHLKNYAKGSRAGWLGADVLSEHKNAQYFGKYINGGFLHEEYVLDFASWKRKFLELQEKVDMIILSGPAGIEDWDEKEAQRFVLKNIKKPTGTESDNMMGFTLIGLSKRSQEQGEHAAKVALRILKGENPKDIPVVTNKEAILSLNLKVAGKLDIIFTLSMLKNAKEIIGIE